MTDDLYYDRNGNPITTERWAELHHSDYKFVANDELNGVRVSTVWLGIDHSFGGPQPLIFETMVFGGERAEDQWRWSTEADALAGHAEICSGVLR